MTDHTIFRAWVETSTGERVPVLGACSIGRAPSNAVVLADERVSRRHAMIQVQEQGEAWLVDLGSSNGTYLDGRRVAEPTRLADRDRIEVGPFCLVFRQSASGGGGATVVVPDQPTIPDLRRATCWLLVADIVGSTQLAQSLPAEQVSALTGDWLAECKQIVTEAEGSIDKYLGDGFFAYWHDGPERPATIARVLRRLQQLQAKGRPPFRVMVHLAEVCTSGMATGGKESLWGQEVHFAFRAERLASTLKEARLLSDPARARLHPALSTGEIGVHTLSGYEGRFRFWRY